MSSDVDTNGSRLPGEVWPDEPRGGTVELWSESEDSGRVLGWQDLYEALQNALESDEWGLVHSILREATREEQWHRFQAPDSQWSEVMLIVAWMGNTQFVELLLTISDGHLLPGTKDRKGFTALHFSALRGHVAIVKRLLISQRNNKELLFSKTSGRAGEVGKGWTALHLAASEGQEEVVDVLIDYLLATPPGNNEMYDLLYDEFGMTPLHYAALASANTAHALMRWKLMNVNALNFHMLTPLHMASLSESHDVVSRITGAEGGVDVNALDCCNYSPLHWAVQVGATNVARILLIHPHVEVIIEDAEGRTPLEIAKTERRTEIVKYLTGIPQVVDYVSGLHRDRQVYVFAASAVLVAAALISSLTYGSWLQPSLAYIPYYQYNLSGLSSPSAYESFATLQQNVGVRVFWVFNCLSFFFAVATIVAAAICLLPVPNVYIGQSARIIRGWLILTLSLLATSVAFVIGAFAAVGLASLPPIDKYETVMTVFVAIGLCVCSPIAAVFLYRLYRFFPDWRLCVFSIRMKISSSRSPNEHGRREYMELQLINLAQHWDPQCNLNFLHSHYLNKANLMRMLRSQLQKFHAVHPSRTRICRLQAIRNVLQSLDSLQNIKPFESHQGQSLRAKTGAAARRRQQIMINFLDPFRTLTLDDDDCASSDSSSFELFRE